MPLAEGSVPGGRLYGAAQSGAEVLGVRGVGLGQARAAIAIFVPPSLFPT